MQKQCLAKLAIGLHDEIYVSQSDNARVIRSEQSVALIRLQMIGIMLIVRVLDCEQCSLVALKKCTRCVRLEEACT